MCKNSWTTNDFKICIVFPMEKCKAPNCPRWRIFPQKNYNLSYLIRYLLPSSYLIRATERQSLINCLAHDSRRATIHQRSAVKESVTAGYFLIGGPTCYIIRNLLHNRFTIEGRHMNNILAVPSCCAVLNFTIKAPLSIYGQLLNWSRSNGTAAVVH